MPAKWRASSFVHENNYLISHHRLEFLGKSDHLGKLLHRRNAANKVLCFVRLLNLFEEVFCYTMTELLNGINTSSFEQLGELWANALDAEGKAILSRIPKNAAVIALCIEGKKLSSEKLLLQPEHPGVHSVSLYL